MTPEQFLTNEGYFEASEFTFDSVAELMLRYAQSQHGGKPLVSGVSNLPGVDSSQVIPSNPQFIKENKAEGRR